MGDIDPLSGQIEQLQQALAAARGRASTDDGAVTIEVGTDGGIHGIELNDLGEQLTASQLAELITDLHGRAKAEAAKTMQEAVGQIHADPRIQAEQQKVSDALGQSRPTETVGETRQSNSADRPSHQPEAESRRPPARGESDGLIRPQGSADRGRTEPHDAPTYDCAPEPSRPQLKPATPVASPSRNTSPSRPSHRPAGSSPAPVFGPSGTFEEGSTGSPSTAAVSAPKTGTRDTAPEQTTSYPTTGNHVSNESTIHADQFSPPSDDDWLAELDSPPTFFDPLTDYLPDYEPWWDVTDHL